MEQRLKQIIAEVVEEKGAWLVELETMPDHVHLLVEVDPQFGHQFALALSSAARYSGTRVVAVPAAFTSQRCSACGHLDPKSRESQAVFRCTSCQHGPVHADVNAAKNILAVELAVTACQDHARPSGRARSLKQEPAGNREELLLQPT